MLKSLVLLDHVSFRELWPAGVLKCLQRHHKWPGGLQGCWVWRTMNCLIDAAEKCVANAEERNPPITPKESVTLYMEEFR